MLKILIHYAKVLAVKGKESTYRPIRVMDVARE